MPEPVNPRKRSLMPSGPLRRALRAAGHHLDPVLQVGKEGVTEAVRRALDAQLLAHELVKVKVGGESPDDRFEVAALLGGGAGTHVAQVLGRTVLVYRRHPEKPRFEAVPPGGSSFDFVHPEPAEGLRMSGPPAPAAHRSVKGSRKPRKGGKRTPRTVRGPRGDAPEPRGRGPRGPGPEPKRRGQRPERKVRGPRGAGPERKVRRPRIGR